MAKNIIRIIACALVASLAVLSISSCKLEQDQVFEESAAVRLTNALTNAQKVLTGAQYGWRMYYYPDNDLGYGGYVYCMQFTNEEVTVYSELFEQPSTSLYKMTRDNGPVLSFDTNNYVFHYFATPSGSLQNLYGESGLYQAYRGDFEFTILSATSQEVVLKGKRTGNLIKMYPLTADEDPAEICNTIYENASSVWLSQFSGTVGGKDVIAYLDLDYRWLSFYEPKLGEDGTVSYGELIAEAPFAYTETGMLFYNPIEVGTQTIETVDWLLDEQSIKVGSDVLKGELPAGWHAYKDFAGTYTLNYQWELDPNEDGPNNLSGVQIVENPDGKTFAVKGLSDAFDLAASYDSGTGTMQILAQVVGNNGTYDIMMCAWDSNAGYITWSTTIGMRGTFGPSAATGEDDGSTIYWLDNGVWGSYNVESFRLYYFSGSTRISGSEAPWIFKNNSTYIWGWKKFTRE